MAGLGGVWQAVVLGFAGLDLMGDVLGMDPKLPPHWGSLSFRVHWRGRIVQVGIAGGVVRATLAAGEAMELRVAGGTRTAGARRDAGGAPVGYRRRARLPRVFPARLAGHPGRGLQAGRAPTSTPDDPLRPMVHGWGPGARLAKASL